MQRAERGQINVKVIGLASTPAPTSVRPAAEAEQIRVSIERVPLQKGLLQFTWRKFFQYLGKESINFQIRLQDLTLGEGRTQVRLINFQSKVSGDTTNLFFRICCCFRSAWPLPQGERATRSS